MIFSLSCNAFSHSSFLRSNNYCACTPNSVLF